MTMYLAPVHHEPMLLIPEAGRTVNPETDKVLLAVKTPEDAAKLPFFARASSRLRQLGSPIRTIPAVS